MSTGFDSIKRSLLEAIEHAKEQAASQSRTRHAPRDTSYDDHLWQALADPKEAAAYLDAVMEMEDQAALMLALRQVAQAQGLGEAKIKVKMEEKPLLDVLNDTEELTIDALNRALHALGLRLSFKPAPEASQKSS
jgi:DNA-binding phage protein